MLRSKKRLMTIAAAHLAGAWLYQGCLVVSPGGFGGPGVLFLNLANFPHFDGDGEDSFLDRVFGFDDDDD